MKLESLWMIAGVAGALVLGSIYGYCIGRLAKRRSWSVTRVRVVSLPPLLLCAGIMMLVSIFRRRYTGYGDSAEAWAKFPWIILMPAAYLAHFVALKVAFPGV